MKSVLFVCLGNICRSPVVEAVARKEFAAAGIAIAVASAGTGDWHSGEPADARAIASAAALGYDASAHRARQVNAADFERFDALLVMDRANLRELERRWPQHQERVKLFLAFAGLAPPHEVPDPYYGDDRDFTRVVELARAGSRGLIERWRNTA